MGIARSRRSGSKLRVGGERALRARHRSRTPSRVQRRTRRWSCSVEVAGAQVAPDAIDVYPRPVDAGPASACATESGERGARHRRSTPRTCGTRSRPLGIELDDADRRRRHRRGHRDRRRRSAPTSTARSTSSRRWRAASASTPSAARCPTRTDQVGGLTVRQQERRLVADVLVGRRAVARRSPSRWCRPPTSSAPARRSTAWSAPTEPAAGRGVGAAHRGAPGPAARGRRQPAPRASPTSRCSRWAACSSRPLERRRAGDSPLPDEPEHVALGAGRAPCAAVRWRTTARSTCTTRSTWCAWSSTRSASTTSSCNPTRSPATAPAAPRASCVDGNDAGAVGEVAPEVLAALGLDAPVVAAELVLDTLLDAAASRPHVPARRRASRRRASTSPSCSPTR